MGFNWKEYDRYEDAAARENARRRKGEGYVPGPTFLRVLFSLVGVLLLAFLVRFRPNLLDFSDIGSRSFTGGLVLGASVALALYFRRRKNTGSGKKLEEDTDDSSMQNSECRMKN